ncbi:MAG: ABC transporter permease [Solirubrobacterales bacterium]
MAAEPGATAVTASPTRRVRLKPSPIAAAYLVVVGLAIVGQIQSSAFLTFNHIAVLLGLTAVLGIGSAGQTVVILSAGIDLSVGAVISATNVLTVQWTHGSDSLLWVVLPILAIGAAIGLLSGLGVALLRISPLIMTLGMASIVSGFVLVVTNGESGAQPAPALQHAMTDRLLGFPGTVWAWLAAALLTVVLLQATRFGRQLLALGANAKAARLAGISPTAMTLGVYAFSGLMAAFAGIVLAGFTGTSAFGIGNQYTLLTIAAVVIGGASILGGRGSYVGTIAGAVILSALTDILTVANVAAAGRQIVQGVAILIILIIYGREQRLRTVS